MIDGRILIRAAFAVLLAACAVPQAVAHTCGDDVTTRYYFLRQPPKMTPDIEFVQVRIVRKTARSVDARLEGRFASLSSDGMIHIVIPTEPLDDNCVDWGSLEGPVYVVASSALVHDGLALIIAEAVEPPEPSAREAQQERRRLWRDAQIYIDPTYANLDGQ